MSTDTTTADALLLDAFAEYLQAAMRSPGTIRTRRQHLAMLARTKPGLLSLEHGDLIGYLAGQDWAQETMRSVRSSLRTFYAWAVDEQLIEHSPAVRLPSVKVGHAVPRPVPEDLLIVMEQQCDDETLLMSRLMSHAGLRRAEVARVHRDDVTTFGLHIVGKGRRQRVVPLHPDLAPLLQARALASSGWLFPGRFGGHCSPDYVASRLEQVLPPGYTCHKLRHRFATRAYQGTRDLFAVQQLLGHSQPETTARYVLIGQDSLLAAVASM